MKIRPASEPAGDGVRLHPVSPKARGWGHEPDTRAAIEWLEEHVKSGVTVCDIGTGTGILALVAAKLGAVVTAYESDPDVREVAKRNITLNRAKVKLLGEYDGADGFDLVVANLGSKVDYDPLGSKVDYAGMGILEAGKEVWTTNG